MRELLELEGIFAGISTGAILHAALGQAAKAVKAEQRAEAAAKKAALAEEALHTVRVGGQLDPPLTVVLDDPAGCAPLPGLPELMATGPGAGLVPVVGLRSLAAARSVWGEAGAAALWDAATLRLVFGGVADPYDLERVRALAPDVDPHGLRPGQALLLHRYVQPLVVRLLDWRRRDYPATDGSRGRVRLARG